MVEAALFVAPAVGICFESEAMVDRLVTLPLACCMSYSSVQPAGWEKLVPVPLA